MVKKIFLRADKTWVRQTGPLAYLSTFSVVKQQMAERDLGLKDTSIDVKTPQEFVLKVPLTASMSGYITKLCALIGLSLNSTVLFLLINNLSCHKIRFIPSFGTNSILTS